MPQPEDSLLRFYADLVADLDALFARAKAGAPRGFIEAQLRALVRPLTALGLAETTWITQHVPAQYRAAARQAQTTLEEADLPVIVGRFTGVDRRAVSALASRVSTDLRAVRTALGRGLALSDVGNLGAKAVEDAIRGDSRLLTFKAGKVSVKVPSGKFWRPDVYARMLSRTAAADTRRVAFRQRYLQNEVDRVRVISTGTAHEVCQVWEEEALSLTGATPGLPTVDDAMAAGLFHPNCTHRYVVDTEARSQVALTEEERNSPPAEPLPILGRRPAASRRPAEARA